MRAPNRPWEVIWEPESEQTLLALWLDARDRAAITEASAAADAALAADPTGAGESRLAFEDAEQYRADVRTAFFGPLTVDFALSEAKREVTVTAVARTRPGPTERRD